MTWLLLWNKVVLFWIKFNCLQKKLHRFASLDKAVTVKLLSFDQALFQTNTKNGFCVLKSLFICNQDFWKICEFHRNQTGYKVNVIVLYIKGYLCYLNYIFTKVLEGVSSCIVWLKLQKRTIKVLIILFDICLKHSPISI